ncbi:hypothetical protein POJ06DRAFT_263183 [Lipomyces tetrasporus]|uniref:DUF21-domain-containing protein n=1 Tax=Lipomyces tetrasporus TaxID=54092 RepID=A0AAD7QKR2_9ASCO|nr:uncharacterized protein POJ06DRAFT_263183 [Lipomyces tetrasporus]KAJ8096705.1 hypothetical protein POJ06DRAFT_263183 [Lipomyces tetrasporus]
MHHTLIPRARTYSTALVKACLLLSANLPVLHSYSILDGNYLHKRDHDDRDDDELDGPEFWIFMSISVTLVLLGGIFAGLTLGLMGQDEVYLQVIEQTGSVSERKNAGKVLSLLKKGKHWVLVTMLLSNVITNETLPIVLDRCLGGGWPAVLSSTILIVIFGEIIPQSVSVRYGLAIGATFAPFVQLLMYAMCPVAYPTALLLDHVLGQDHGTVYRKAQLKTLVTLHRSMGAERLNKDEVTIISAVLDLNEKPVGNIMTPMQDVYTMSADRILDEAAVEEILKAGYSRIPIHTPNEPHNFIGMLLVRILISYDPEDAQPVSTFPLATLPETKPDTTCLNVLNYFQEGKSHMMLVSASPGEPYGALGVVTLEDVIEELIGEEIVDESDVYVDISQGIRRKYVSPLTRRTLPAQFVAQHTAPLGDALGGQPIPKISLDGSSGQATGTAHRNSHGSAMYGSGANVLKVEPLNLALRPMETSNAKVTIKKGAMEDYVRRASMDARSTQFAQNGATADSADAKYGKPQAGVDFGTIHESERAALVDGPPTAAYGDRSNSYIVGTLSTKPRQRRPSSIELDSIASKNIMDEINASNELRRDHGVITPGSAISEPESVTSTTRLLDNDHDHESEFHASGIIESIREVRGFQKTIIEATPMSDDDSQSDSDSEESDSNSSHGSRSSRGGLIPDLERGPTESSKTDMKKKKLERTDSGSNSSGGRTLSFRKGSFFSDRGFRPLSGS